MPSILVINPNSSEKVTSNLRKILVPPPGIDLEFYTAPSSAPKEIDGAESLELSEKETLPDILAKNLHHTHDGFLVCCYSDHPLVHSLAENTTKPVLGIMQATLLYSYANARIGKLLVLTSTSGWNDLLDDAITRFAGCGVFPEEKFHRTKALDVLVTNLADAAEFSKITTRVEAIFAQSGEPDCVLLGCAGMAGLDEKLAERYTGVVFVDSVKIGVEFLCGLMRFEASRS